MPATARLVVNRSITLANWKLTYSGGGEMQTAAQSWFLRYKKREQRQLVVGMLLQDHHPSV